MSDRGPIEVERLVAAVRRGAEETVIEAFRGRTEPERRAVAVEIFGLGSTLWLGPTRRSWYGACFACGTLSEIKRLRLGHQYGEMCNDVTYEVLVDRRPGWVTGWAQWALDREATPSGRAPGLWTLVRKLIRAGVCKPLDTDTYILGMVFGLGSYQYNCPHHEEEAFERHIDASRRTSLPALLLEDPGLLEHEIWRIFEVPGRPSRQLGAKGLVRDSWSRSLVWLSHEGHIDRQRLRTATLAALARDITVYQANWFIPLWWMLGPTAVERKHHQPALLHLLARSVPAVVQFALGELEKALDEGVLDTAAFVEEVEPVLLTMPVTTVKHALKLLDRVVQVDFGTRTNAMTAVAAALLHTNKSVRAAAVRFLTRHAQPPDRELAQIVDGHLDALTDDQVAKLHAV